MSTKSIKKSFFASLVSLVLCFAMLIGTTYAWFTDSASSAGNKIIAGNLDVELWLHNESNSVNIGDSSEPIFGVNSSDPLAQNNAKDTLWEPGKTQTVFLSIKNAGTLDLKYKVALDVYNVTKNLDKFMSYQITPGAKVGDKVEWTAGTNVSAGTNLLATDEIVALKAGQEHFFALSVHMDELATNEQMNGTIEFDIKVLATQLNSEADFYGPNYDKDATYPEVISKLIGEDATGISADIVTVGVPKDSAGRYNLSVSNQEVSTDATTNETTVSFDVELTKDNVAITETTADGTVYTVVVKVAEPGTPLNIVNVTHKGEEVSSFDYDQTHGLISFQTTHFSPFAVTYYNSNVTAEELVNLISKGGNFTLTEDMTLDSSIEIPADAKVTINLGGHTVKGTVGRDENNSRVHTLINHGELVLTNGTVQSAGINGGSAIYNAENATLTVNGVTVLGAPKESESWPSYGINNYGNMTLNGATVKTYHGGVATCGNAVTVINNTSVDVGQGTNTGITSYALYTDGSAQLTVNSGSFANTALDAGNTGGAIACSAASNPIVILGGDFRGGCGFYGSFTIYGGTFDRDVTSFLPDGFKLMDNGYVVPEDVDFVITSVADFMSLSAKAFTGNNGVAESYTVMLATDLDLKGAEFSTIIAQRGDTLTFLGNGHKISNVKFVSGLEDNTTGQASMFYAYPESTLNVSNLTLENVTVVSDAESTGYAAAVVGYCEGAAVLNNVDVKGATVIGVKSSGLLVGHLSAGASVVATDCDLEGTVTLADFAAEANGHYAGKYFGTLSGTATLNNCTVSATVSGNLNAANKGEFYGRTVNGTLVVDGYTCIGDGICKDGVEYRIYNANGLATINAMMANKTAGKGIIVELMADIDFAGKTWTPVDSHADTAFEIAEINGNGHTIYNLTIKGQAMFTRFAGTGDVVIKDITFDGANVNSNGAINTSILTVQTYQNILLDNVDVKNSTITGGYKVAPLIGTVYNESASTITATIKNCDVSNTVVTATVYDFFTCGMIAFVYTTNNDYVEYENCTVTDVQLRAVNVYSYHANIHYTSADTDDQINEHPGVTVTNVTFENI